MGLFLLPSGTEAASCGLNYAFSGSPSCGGSSYRGSSIGYAFGSDGSRVTREYRNSNRYNYNSNYDYGFGGYRTNGYNNYAFGGNYGFNYYYGGNYAFY